MALFCVGGDGTSDIATSPDGITWTSRTLPVSTFWGRMAWNGSVFCIIQNGTGVNAATSPDGITWTARTLPASVNWQGLVWNGSVFCAIAATTNIAATSPDGITWTTRTMPNTRDWRAISWNGSVFCVISYNASICATSPDGITWTEHTLPTSNTWWSISWSGSLFCAVASNTTIAATSPDGITWTARTLPISLQWTEITYGNGLFCLVGNLATSVYTSPDGITWTARSIPALDFPSIAWSGNSFCISSVGGNTNYTSPDGITWTTRTFLTGSWAFIGVRPDHFFLNSSSNITLTVSSITNHTVFDPFMNTIIYLTPSSTTTYAKHYSLIGGSSIVFNTTTISKTQPVLTYIYDTLNITSLMQYSQLSNIVEQITISLNTNQTFKVSSLISEYITILDSILIKFNGTVSESLILASSLTSLLTKIELLTSSLTVLDSINTKGILVNQVISLIKILEELDYRSVASISEIIIITSTISSLYKALNTLVISLVSSDTISGTRISVLSLIDNLSINPTLSNKTIFKNLLSDYFIISIPSASGQDNYLAYSLTLENTALTTYSNYNFNGCTNNNGKYLFINKNGLFEYGGTLDDNTLIQARLKTVAYNFGSSNLKQVPSVYLGLTSSGATIMKVSVDGKGEVIYKLNKKTQGLDTQKIAIGKGMIGRYFQFELITSSTDFSIESLEFYPVMLQRKL